MEIILAGHNVDAEVLQQLKDGTHDGSDNVTPEVISAAYARISRDPSAVTELRAQAREDVAAARRSNRNIVFGMSHHSVAEHAYINFDALGVSRLAIEALEARRLCAFTEKSQRYITLDGDVVIPKEFTPAERGQFEALVERQNAFYNEVLPQLKKLQKGKNPGVARGTRDGWAKEDARYSLSMATEGQLGFSANARNLEHAVRLAKFHPLAEVREMGRLLYEEARKVAPSLVAMGDEADFAKITGGSLDNNFLEHYAEDFANAVDGLLERNPGVLEEVFAESRAVAGKREEHFGVRLADHNDVDENVVSALIRTHFAKKGIDLAFSEAKAYFRKLHFPERKKFVQEGLQSLGQYDALPREFEVGNLTYDITLSASAFAQLKRHRMATLLTSPYDPNLGITVPESIEEIGRAADLVDVCGQSADFWKQLEDAHPEAPGVGEYALTNAHRRRALFDMNARELHHLSRMREDGHAQWDIRYIAHEVSRLAKHAAPITTMLLGGKDQFADVKAALYASAAK